jgi:2-polyprenyl-3-methyl-5-hydroxy-6-metoxy-1,4-benzoquinol methylase
LGSEREWEAWGKQDPYFGVLAHEQFRRAKLTDESLAHFFELGRFELAQIQSDCRRYFGHVSMRQSLDFGCGVGRFLIPLAAVSDRCFGVDISDAMRDEAEVNCAKFGLKNVCLTRTVDEVPATEEGFSFVHSYIVLQHIETERGLQIIGKLLDRLGKDGTAALHVTYAKRKYSFNLGAQPLYRRLISQAGLRLKRLTAPLRGGDPEMQMNFYDLNRLLFLFQEKGMQTGGMRFTDHVGNLGLMFYVHRGT